MFTDKQKSHCASFLFWGGQKKYIFLNCWEKKRTQPVSRAFSDSLVIVCKKKLLRKV